MLVMRLSRVGRKHHPAFKIVVLDKKNPPVGGNFVDEVGFYNPKTKEKFLRKEKILSWLEKGVKPSDTVYNLLVKEGILQSSKKKKHKEKGTKENLEEKSSAEDKTG